MGFPGIPRLATARGGGDRAACPVQAVAAGGVAVPNPVRRPPRHPSVLHPPARRAKVRGIRPKRKAAPLSSPIRRLYALTLDIVNAMDERNLGVIAAGVAFYALLAVFPALAATIAIWGFFADPGVISTYLAVAAEFVPAEAVHLVEDQLAALMTTTASTLGWATLVSIAVALYSVRNGVDALVRGLNAAHARRQRGTAARFLVALLMAISLIGLVLAALATTLLAPFVLAFVPNGPLHDWLTGSMPWVVMFFAIFVTLGILYRYGPNHPVQRAPWITPGAFIAALLWAGASLAFSVYLANFGSYNRIYGSIGAVIALIMWFYISAYTILLGAVVNAELNRRREDDSRPAVT